MNKELPQSGGAKNRTRKSGGAENQPLESGGEGDDSAPATADGPPVGESLTRVDPLAVAKRLQKRSDWPEIARERNWRIKEARADGLLRPEAQQRAYEELDRRYPGSSPEPETPAQTPPGDQESGVSGLSDLLPSSWPTLPASASLQADVQWVAANRLTVLVRPGVVDLSRALVPAPSYSALDWLDTALSFPAKFADVRMKATQHQEDEREHVRRERLAIEDTRGLLAEMVDAPPAT